MTSPDPSKHTTRQEVEKLARTRCLACGLTAAVGTIIKDGTCVNLLACEKRQKRNERAKGKKP